MKILPNIGPEAEMIDYCARQAGAYSFFRLVYGDPFTRNISLAKVYIDQINSGFYSLAIN